MLADLKPVGNGNCYAGSPVGVNGDLCEYKHGSKGVPLADWGTNWIGTHTVGDYRDWKYFNTASDSVNDEVSWLWNRDDNSYYLYEDPDFDPPRSCFPKGYDSTDLKGREDNATGHVKRGAPSC